MAKVQTRCGYLPSRRRLNGKSDAPGGRKGLILSEERARFVGRCRTKCTGILQAAPAGISLLLPVLRSVARIGTAVHLLTGSLRSASLPAEPGLQNAPKNSSSSWCSRWLGGGFGLTRGSLTWRPSRTSSHARQTTAGEHREAGVTHRLRLWRGRRGCGAIQQCFLAAWSGLSSGCGCSVLRILVAPARKLGK